MHVSIGRTRGLARRSIHNVDRDFSMASTITLHSDYAERLSFRRMHAREALGELFDYQLTALWSGSTPTLRTMLGKPMAVEVSTASGSARWFHGIVAEAAQVGFEQVDGLAKAVLELRLVPRPWLLTQRRDCRIYNDKTVPEIVKAVLSDIGYGDVQSSLSTSYPTREYCVQYREDDFNFISRLMEQEGIYYYFSHSKSAHTMVLCDGLGGHSSAPGAATLPYLPPDSAAQRGGVTGIGQWRSTQALHTTLYQLTDYAPAQPRVSLAGEASASGRLHAVDGLTAFDYPGAYDDSAVGKRYAQIRGEARNVERARQQGQTDAAGLAVGTLFRLQGAPQSEAASEYLVIAAETELHEPLHGAGDEGVPIYACEFQAIDSQLPFRNLARATRPVIAGLQTGVVSGDTDEDIEVDEQGRVQVVFHWSTSSRTNGGPSCPVRVASGWAGKGWGLMNLPRVGQEVVVSFLEGDPDRPLVVGSVYNGDHDLPFSLPDQKTRSGLRSRSLLGTSADFNELSFEDKAGAEEIFVHAQRDLREEVENDHQTDIDNDQRLTVKRNQQHTVNGDRAQQIDGEDTLQVGKSVSQDIAKVLTVNAGEKIELVTGSSKLVMNQDGTIELSGVKITIKASASLTMTSSGTFSGSAGGAASLSSGAALNLKGAASANLKGALVTVAATGINTISGALIKVG